MFKAYMVKNTHKYGIFYCYHSFTCQLNICLLLKAM